MGVQRGGSSDVEGDELNFRQPNLWQPSVEVDGRDDSVQRPKSDVDCGAQTSTADESPADGHLLRS